MERNCSRTDARICVAHIPTLGPAARCIRVQESGARAVSQPVRAFQSRRQPRLPNPERSLERLHRLLGEQDRRVELLNIVALIDQAGQQRMVVHAKSAQHYVGSR